MKANEFVKKFGWDRAKEIVNGAGEHHRYFIADGISVTYSKYGDCFDSVDDLKRLVESWELVESLGGVVKAESNLSSVRYNLNIGLFHGWDKLNMQFHAQKLLKAIADVESCQ